MGLFRKKRKTPKPDPARVLEKAAAKPVDRRNFLKGLGAGSGLALAGRAEGLSLAEFFQKHYLEMSPADKQELIKRLKKEARHHYGRDIQVSDARPLPGVKFAYFLNLSVCNGSRRCIEACRKENNQDAGIDYIKVLEIDKGTLNLEKGDMYYKGESVPAEGKFYMPVSCHQCDNPPCVRACPVEATWKEEDGIVAIDYDWCIGCRYCQAACPYEARHFNFRNPQVEHERFQPDQGLLSNRSRRRGVMEKCHFCMHRTRRGELPACQEACPTGARVFGNILDPKSEVSAILREKRIFILKEELNTVPSFFYYFD